VQSAHIYPKARDGSDDVRNGLCLCRRHHWALDVGWIALADDYTILVRDTLPDKTDYDFIRDYSGQPISQPEPPELAAALLFLREHRRITQFDP
jgi:putative restriction endonuclease